MSTKMGDEIKRWTTKRKSALVLDIIQGKTTMAYLLGFNKNTVQRIFQLKGWQVKKTCHQVQAFKK